MLAYVRTIEAEKRTALAFMRTGIMIATVSLSIFTVLISASKFYDAWSAIIPLTILLSICSSLLLLGIWMVVKAFKKIRSCDKKINAVKKCIEEDIFINVE